MFTTPPTGMLAGTLLFLGCISGCVGCHSSSKIKLGPVSDACEVLTPSEISAVLGMPIDAGKHAINNSPIMCGWTRTGASDDPEVILNFQRPDYFEKEREPHPRITMTPAPGIGDDAYYITSELGTSLFIKRGNSVIGFTIRDKSIPSADLMAKERALGLKAAERI